MGEIDEDIFIKFDGAWAVISDAQLTKESGGEIAVAPVGQRRSLEDSPVGLGDAHVVDNPPGGLRDRLRGSTGRGGLSRGIGI